MKIKNNPEETSRASAFAMWMTSPMPMVTIFKTIDITRLVRLSRKKGLRFNMLMCYCIGRAASQVREFFVLPENGRLMRYDALGINVIVKDKKGDISSCDIPFDGDFSRFKDDYDRLTKQCAETGESILDEQRMIIGTSALSQFDIDGVVNQYSDKFNNPMLFWGKYRSRWFRKYLKLSFQFHHVQMDGEQACMFLEYLQKEIQSITKV